jgi:hypothetical protein
MIVNGLADIGNVSRPSGNLGGGVGASSFISARVIDIVLDDAHPKFKEVGEWNGIGTIFYQTTQNQTTDNSTLQIAKPALPNNKHYPLINEIVYLFSLPSPDTQNSGQNDQQYYFSPVNIWNSQHHNGLPNGLVLTDEQKDDYQQTEAGNVRRVTDGSTEIELGQTFKEKANVNPLLPFEGDVIYEGRWGNSIRFGSTINGKTNWSQTGENGDPITLIRNGEDPNNGDEGWIPVVEDINKDISSIWMGSTQQIPLEAASSLYNSYSSPPTKPSEYAGSQIIINSDRVIINSKTDHIMLSSAKSVSLNAVDSVNIDTKEHIVDADSIKLGSKDATESLMLGDKTIELLSKILDENAKVSKALAQLAGKPIIGGAAPDPGTINTATQSAIKLNSYKNQLKSLLSKQNKTI